MLEAIDMVLPGPAVAATFGLIIRDDDGHHRWICHEAITTPEAIVAPRYARSSEGTFLGVVPALEQVRDPGESVYRSVDGCDWEPVSGLTDQVITRVAFAPDDPLQAVAGSANLADGAESSLFVSTDGGQSFTMVRSETERLFRSLRFSAGVPGQVFASAVWYTGSEGWLYTSTDGGETWSDRPVPNPANLELFDVDVVAVSPTEAGTAWVVVGPYGDDTVYKVTDGDIFTPVIENFPGDIIDGTVDDAGGVWLVASGSRLLHAPDGERFTEIDSPPGGLGIAADGMVVYPTGLAQSTTLLYAQTDDQGRGFSGDVFLMDIQEPPSCPADSDVTEVCVPLWPKMSGRLPYLTADTGSAVDSGSPPPGDTGEPEEATDCGCRGSGKAAGVLTLGVGLLGWRRRC
jgi:hypothetical protein